MPVNKKMMANMKKEYGEEKGEKVYFATENKMKKKGSAKAALRHKLLKMKLSSKKG